jgi:hypothetical protein
MPSTLAGYALCSSGYVGDHSSLIIHRCALSAKQQARVKSGETIEHVVDHDDAASTEPADAEPKYIDCPNSTDRSND